MTRNPLLPIALALASSLITVACEEKKPAAPEPVDPCPEVSLDKLAGDWVQVNKGKGDPNNRFRVLGSAPDYEAIMIPGDFNRYPLKGSVRQDKGDIVFDEVLSDKDRESWEAGRRWKIRLSLEPNKKKCAFRAGVATVTMEGGKEVEKRRPPGYEEYVTFPKDLDFVFDRCTGPLFVGPDAKNRKAQEAALKDGGKPSGEATHSQTLPIGVYTRAADDGDAACSYDMDVYFDDRPAKDSAGATSLKAIAAGKVEGDYRHWYLPDLYAPYSGPHHVQLYRYRTCGGAKRELVGISCLLTVLD